jgi:exodeoxyribonuclease-5
MSSEAVSATDRLTDEQYAVFVTMVREFIDNPTNTLWKTRNELHIGGLAGTGKTTGIAAILESCEVRVRVATPTGRAASALRSKGVEATTLHKLLYRPHFETYVDPRTGTKMRRKLTDVSIDRDALAREFDLIVVDEASMVNSKDYANLARQNVPTIYVGDHGQLEPVDPDAENPINVVAEHRLDAKLETVHRQADDSAILRLAHHIRNGGSFGNFRATRGDVRIGKRGPFEDLPSADVYLAHRNASVQAINAVMRRRLGRVDLLEVGERIVCRQNSAEHDVANGDVLIVANVAKKLKNAAVCDLQDPESGEIRPGVPVWLHGLGGKQRDRAAQPSREVWFDYGYALTVHLSQGSEFRRVVFIDEAIGSPETLRRLRYTAITRAARDLSVFYSPEAPRMNTASHTPAKSVNGPPQIAFRVCPGCGEGRTIQIATGLCPNCEHAERRPA